MLRHARRSGGDDARACGAVYAAIGRRDDTAEADTDVAVLSTTTFVRRLAEVTS